LLVNGSIVVELQFELHVFPQERRIVAKQGSRHFILLVGAGVHKVQHVAVAVQKFDFLDLNEYVFEPLAGGENALLVCPV
jgi:sulfate adenylyltransferase subunit 1 (EFTu-like GTPase family)